jgi:DNA-binding transcriptional ArsR family regulator
MSSAGERHVIRTRKQLRALTSAARQEIVDVLAEMGTASVAEIAATLGRPADALYFHLRALQNAGLVKQAGDRERGRRREALFRTVAPELFLHYEPASRENRRAVTAIVSSMLRLGIRDFRRAFEGGDVIVAGPHRELWALRRTARLSLQQVAEVNRSIVRLRKSASGPQRKGRLYGITILLTPLDHRARGSKRSKRSTGMNRK